MIPTMVSGQLRLHGVAPCTVSFRLHPARRRFQPPPSPVVVILTAGDPTNTAVYTVGDRAFPVAGSRLMEQSSARRYLSLNAACQSRLNVFGGPGPPG